MRVRVLMVLALLVSVAAPTGLAQSRVAPRATSRVVVIGDVHGAFNQFENILQHAGIIDASRRWIAGNTTLVQVGDFTDRGAKVRAVMDLLMDLENQAPAAGGRVEVMLGNHEVLNILGDGRYLTPAIYETFADDQSEQRRQAAYEEYVKLCAARSADLPRPTPALYQPHSETGWMTAHPLGFVEYRQAFSAQGRYGRWLRAKSAVLRIEDTVFLHGGINPARAPRRLEDFNKQIGAEIKRFDDYLTRMVDRKLITPFFTLSEMLVAAQIETQAAAAVERRNVDSMSAAGGIDSSVSPDPLGLRELLRIESWALLNPDGPLWFRGFATWSSSVGAIQAPTLLRRYNVAHFVVGHTIPDNRRITPRFSGAIFLIDTGMLASYAPGGVASALEIRDGAFTAIYADARVPLETR